METLLTDIDIIICMPHPKWHENILYVTISFHLANLLRIPNGVSIIRYRFSFVSSTESTSGQNKNDYVARTQ